MAPSIEVIQHVESLSNFQRPIDFEPSFEFETNVVKSSLINQVKRIDHNSCEPGEEDSFFVADLGEIKRSLRLWRSKLPHVTPHYAVKCNTDVEVVRLLGENGVNFDCASKNEIDLVLGLGFSADRIVYANPCKTNSFIRHAGSVNVNLTTVDNCHELYKIQRHHPDCGILIRIVTDDSEAQCRLSTKFGCSVKTAIEELLPLAVQLNLTVRGVAFHVGSGAKDFSSIWTAVSDAKTIFEAAETSFGITSMDTLDIGGGFEGSSFEESSDMVTRSLENFFPSSYIESRGIRFIAEPGRFMVANAFTLATHVIARRDISAKLKEATGTEAMIYINDGVYGNLNCILFDHQHPQAHVLSNKDKFYYHDTDAKGKYQFSIWGPTCDGLDCVAASTVLSENVEVGDWLYFPNVGAYTSAASTSFNGFKALAETIYVDSTQ